MLPIQIYHYIFHNYGKKIRYFLSKHTIFTFLFLFISLPMGMMMAVAFLTCMITVPFAWILGWI